MIRNLFIIGSICLLFSCSKQILNSTSRVKRHSFDTLRFSGYTWQIRDSHDAKQGPGPNRWKGANAYVDSHGDLHLKITKEGEKWYSSEITSMQKFGYGTYQWQVQSKFDTLARNIIIGLFNYSGVDGRDEIDIELGRWAKEKFNNTSYTIYPSQDARDTANWNKTFNTIVPANNILTTQRFTWNSNKSVLFQEMMGFHDDDTNQVDSVTCYNPPHSISSLPMPVHMNFWVFESDAPANHMPAEVIIHSFKFTPKQP